MRNIAVVREQSRSEVWMFGLMFEADAWVKVQATHAQATHQIAMFGINNDVQPQHR